MFELMTKCLANWLPIEENMYKNKASERLKKNSPEMARKSCAGSPCSLGAAVFLIYHPRVRLFLNIPKSPGF